MAIKQYREKALFGLIDGLNGATGLIVGLLMVQASVRTILVALLAPVRQTVPNGTRPPKIGRSFLLGRE